MRLKKVLLWVLPLLSLSITIFILLNQESQPRTVSTKKEIPVGTKNKGYNWVGRGIELLNENGQVIKGFTIETNKNETEIKYNVKIINNTEDLTNSTLIAYLDYKQIPIQISDVKSAVNRYDFTVKSWDNITIPVKFKIGNLSNGPHSFVIQIIDGVNKKAFQMSEGIPNFYATTSRYLISNSKMEPIVSGQKPNPVKDTFEANFSGLLINQDFKNIGNITLPPKQITAHPGEKVNLAIRAGGYNDTDNYVAWMLIGWNQVAISENTDSWFFQTKIGELAYKKITIIAPLEKGDYEVVGFVMDNPWSFSNNVEHKISKDRFYPITSSSYRITLHVE